MMTTLKHVWYRIKKNGHHKSSSPKYLTNHTKFIKKIIYKIQFVIVLMIKCQTIWIKVQNYIILYFNYIKWFDI